MAADAILRFIDDPANGDFDTLARRAAESDAGSPDPALGRAAVTAALSLAGLDASGRRPALALAAEGESPLVDEILALHGDDASARPIKPRGVDPVATRSWLAARQRDHGPALLAGPSGGFEGLLKPIERRGLKFRLSAGSAALVVRGSGEAPEEGLKSRLVESLGLAADRLWLVWEPAAAATPFVARWDGRDRFVVPHWVAAELDADRRLVMTDLANWGVDLRVETGVRAAIDADRFVLL